MRIGSCLKAAVLFAAVVSTVGASALRAAGPNFRPSSQNSTKTPLEWVPKAANPGLRASAIKGLLWTDEWGGGSSHKTS